MNATKVVFWVIAQGPAVNGDWFNDDKGGHMFLSEELAKQAFDKWKPHACSVQRMEMDADLAQMGRLYHETANK